MRYQDFNEEDFAADSRFQRWAIEPDAESDLFWQQWLADYPEKRPTLTRARWLLQNLSFQETWSTAERTRMWETIRAGAEATDSEPAIVRPLWGRPVWRRVSWAAAGVAAVAISAALLYGPWRQPTIETAYGERRQVRLDDGSVVTLNAHSTLRLARDFLNQPDREVWIEGEAFFDVAKRSVGGRRVPFVVHANQVVINVLGTAFNVINRRSQVDVALEHGLVRVADGRHPNQAVLLRPGERVSQAPEQVRLVKQPVRIEEYTAWKADVILFKQKSLRAIAEMMKDLYDIDVVIDNPDLERETFTGSFPADSAQVLFDKLQKVYPIQVRKEGTVYHLN